MKKLFRILKSQIKKIITAQMQAHREEIVTVVPKSVGIKTPLSDKELEHAINVIYNTLVKTVSKG